MFTNLFLLPLSLKPLPGVDPSYQKKRFSTFNNSILQFKNWLIENQCRDVCMESTGKYWVPVFNLLEDDINVVIANPKWVKAVKGNKDDTKDSKWIGDLFRLGLVKGSYIPCKKIRILREFTRYRYKIVSCRSSEKNRYHQMTDSQKYRMRLVRAHMDYITAEINDVDREIEKLISSDPDFENAIQFLMTIPGVKRDSAITIISETGIDMSQFCSSKRLCCWAGLVPGSNESGGKKKSVRVTRAGVYLKPALVQCAHAAVKSDKSPYYKKKYESLVKRRGKKRAIIAIARMILTAIYQMLSTGEQWNPSDLYKIDMPVALVEKQKAKAIKQARKLLQREGLLPPDEPLAS